MQPVIPIVLLHHGQPDVLLRTLQHLAAHTRVAHQIFVVDNASPPSAPLDAALERAAHEYSAVVIRNPKNNWIYGFNLALDHPRWPDAAFYAFSDADVLVPPVADGQCWLERMLAQMAQHRCIGKLGLSLDLTALAQNPALRATYESERRLLTGETIGTNIIASVDTTMALYRNDFFIGNFRFRIGHQSLARPYYYICRTMASFNAIHVGWDFYPGAGQAEYSDAKQWRKALAMCKMGTYVAPEILSRFGLLRRSALLALQASVRLVHGLKLAVMVSCYVLRRFPRNLNELQSKVR